MLRQLDIRDILIIDRLELAFQPGLNVLTGETGAGKSILLDSLGFVLGWRGRAELVRQGAEQGEVSAVFELDDHHPAWDVLHEAGFSFEPELIIRRVNSLDGRKTAWINDRRVSGEILRAVSERLIELHGQHDDRGLLNPRGHLMLLDEYARHQDLQQNLREAWRNRVDAEKALAGAKAQREELQAEEDFLRHSVLELDALAPKPGEDETLDAKRRLMQASEKIGEDIAKAHQALGLQGAEGMLGDALRWLESAAGRAGGALDAPLAAIERALTELGEAYSGVEIAMEQLNFNPHELEEVEERLFALRGLARKHDVQPDDLADVAEDFRSRLDALDHSAADLAKLEAATSLAEQSYESAAEILSKSRHRAGEALDRAMAQELAPLKMERAEFATQIQSASPSVDGIDQVAFTVATNPGAPAGPIGKIASGGELSRFLLALKVCLTGADTGQTLIFDEIDRGVGGATADAVGRRLAQLAQGGQVLVVTHSPQVAALGNHHWRVEKHQSAEQTLSTVVGLHDEARIDEIARMISGDKISDEARAAARALLNGS